jgi:hypothetical protein
MSDDFDRANDTINRRAAQLLRAFTAQAWGMLVNGTPVDTPEYSDRPGVARGNWNLSLGAEDTTFSEGRANAHGPVPELPNEPVIGKDVFMTNATPYIEVLEYGRYPVPVMRGSFNRVTRRYVIKSRGGFSQQAPAGWVRLTASALEPMADDLVRQVARE